MVVPLVPGVSPSLHVHQQPGLAHAGDPAPLPGPGPGLHADATLSVEPPDAVVPEGM